jgi:hypothetical protein
LEIFAAYDWKPFQSYFDFFLGKKYKKRFIIYFFRFEMVDNPEEADILWLTYHFKQFKELSATPAKRINQFPFEHVLTIKDLLPVVCRRIPDSNSNSEKRNRELIGNPF